MREIYRSKEHEADPDRTLGGLAVWWMQAFCVHGPGDVQGMPVTLDAELARLTWDVYALEPSGRRCYDSAFYSAPKGTDKSGHAARLTLFEAIGPCRFNGWATADTPPYEFMGKKYRYEVGEPIGRQVVYPFIRNMATEETQTGNVYDAVHYNLTEGPLSVLKIDCGLTRTNLPDGGKIIPSTASGAAKDGGKETFATFDETHLYILPELRRMHSTVVRNLVKRKESEPWYFEPTTMYSPGELSVAEDSYLTMVAVREGRARARMFGDHRQADPKLVEQPLREMSQKRIREALHQSYGAAIDWMDSDRLISQAQDPRNSEADTRRYFFNQPWTSVGSWLRYGSWESCEDKHEVKDATEIVLTLDGSFNNDSTVLFATTVPDLSAGELPYGFPVGLWEKPPNDPHWRVPMADVEARAIDVAKKFTVVELAADPFRWQRSLENLQAEGLPCVEYGQTAQTITPALMAWHAAIMEKRYTHDGDPAVMRHVYNATLKEDTRGKKLVKDSLNSPRKIDAAITALMGYDRALFHATSDAEPTVLLV
jgi:hypothetical protein